MQFRSPKPLGAASIPFASKQSSLSEFNRHTQLIFALVVEEQYFPSYVSTD